MNKSKSVKLVDNILGASVAPLGIYKPFYMTMAIALSTCLLVADLNGIIAVPFWLALFPVYAPAMPFVAVLSVLLALCGFILAMIIVVKIVQLVFKSIYYVCRTIYRTPRYFRDWCSNVNTRK